MVKQTSNMTEVDYDTLIQTYLYTQLDRLIIGFLNPTIVGIGIIGNFITILVLTRCPRMQTSLNVYLTSLAIADMMFLIMAPILAWQSLINSDIFDMFDHSQTSLVFCKVNNLIVETSYQVAYLMILCISVERYLAICRPLQYRTYGTRLRAAKICFAVWIVDLIYQSKILITMTLTIREFPWPYLYKGLPNVSTVCTICDPEKITRYRIISDLYTFDIIIGLLVMFTLIPLYTAMIRRLRNSRFANNGGKQRRKGQDMAIFRTVLLTVSIYALCYTPFNILNIVSVYFEIDFEVVKKSVIIFRPLMYINAAVNPIIYNMTNTNYRQSFLEFFRCKTTNNVGNSRDRRSSSLTDTKSIKLSSLIQSDAYSKQENNDSV